jgi:hypothetical protein
LQDLALGALPTVNQKAELVMNDHLAGKPTVNGGCRSGCTEENDFEQENLKGGEKSVETLELYLISMINAQPE